VYATTNQQGEPFGLSTAAIYQQMALPLCDQQLPVQYLAQPVMVEIYRDWKALNVPE